MSRSHSRLSLLFVVTLFVANLVALGDCISAELHELFWLASYDDESSLAASQNRAEIVFGEDEFGSYYAMTWTSPEPVDLTIGNLDLITFSSGVETIKLVLASATPMTAEVHVSVSGDYCDQAWQVARLPGELSLSPKPQVFELHTDSSEVASYSTCLEEFHEDAFDSVSTIVLFPSSHTGELRVYGVSMCGDDVESTRCSFPEPESVLVNGSFESPTIDQAISDGAEGEPGEAAWFVSVAGWEHSEEPGLNRAMVVDGTQCFYWNDPVNAWLRQSVAWDDLHAEPGDTVELTFWSQIGHWDGAREAGKTIAFSAELFVGDALLDQLAATQETDPARDRLSFVAREDHIGHPVTVRFWADGNRGWSGDEQVQSIFIDDVRLAVQPQDQGLRAQGVCHPESRPFDGPAVTVEFPDPTYYMAFDPPDCGFYYVNGVYAIGNEWAEANIHGDCFEVGFDWSGARTWIESASPARVVVRYRGALANNKGEIAHTDRESGSPYGEGDWADEWYYIYPDGLSVRHVRIYSGYAQSASSFWSPSAPVAFETQETFVRGLVAGHQPMDDMEIEPITLVKLDGTYRRISYLHYPAERDLFPGSSIQIVNVYEALKPFTIVPGGNTDIMPYWGPPSDQVNLYSTKVVAWPRVPYFENGYTSALTHVINRSWHRQTEKTLEQVYLLGLTDTPEEEARVVELAQLATSWQYAPEAWVVGGDGDMLEYQMEEKAYHVNGTSSDLAIRFDASDEQPLVDPCLVVQGWSEDTPFELLIDNRPLHANSDFYYGFENSEGDTQALVLWIDLVGETPTKLRLVAKPG